MAMRQTHHNSASELARFSSSDPGERMQALKEYFSDPHRLQALRGRLREDFVGEAYIRLQAFLSKKPFGFRDADPATMRHSWESYVSRLLRGAKCAEIRADHVQRKRGSRRGSVVSEACIGRDGAGQMLVRILCEAEPSLDCMDRECAVAALGLVKGHAGAWSVRKLAERLHCSPTTAQRRLERLRRLAPEWALHDLAVEEG